MKKTIIFFCLALVISISSFAENTKSTTSCVATINDYQRKPFFLLDQITRNFSQYIDYRAGLIRQAEYEDKIRPSDKAEFLLYKSEYVKNRNFYRAELQGRLIEARYFFDANTQKLIEAFIAWDNAHIGDSIDDKTLLTTAQYEAWQNKIIGAMVKQLKASDKRAGENRIGDKRFKERERFNFNSQ